MISTIYWRAPKWPCMAIQRWDPTKLRLLASVGIEPWKAWHDIIDSDSFIILFIYVSWFCLNISFVLLFYLSIHTLHHLHYTWLGCIRSCTEDPSHGFLVEWWVVHNWFMDLGYPSETVVHYLLIGGIACLGYRDGCPMVSVLVHVIRIGQDLQWIMTQGYQLSWFTKLLYCMNSQPWEDIELVPNLIGGFDLWVRP